MINPPGQFSHNHFARSTPRPRIAPDLAKKAKFTTNSNNENVHSGRWPAVPANLDKICVKIAAAKICVKIAVPIFLISGPGAIFF